jgi:hypothetical protein
MMRRACLLPCLFLALPLLAQVDSLALRYASTITTADLERHLRILASDAYQGRDTGKEGQKMAAAYLRDQFMAMGVPPIEGRSDVVDGYYQPYMLIEERSGPLDLVTAKDTLQWMQELLYFQDKIGMDFAVDRLHYMGRGGDAAKAGNLKDGVVLVALPGDPADLFMAMRDHAERTAKSGARLLLLAQPGLAQWLASGELTISHGRLRQADAQPKPRNGLQVMAVDDAKVQALLASGRWAAMKRSRKARVIPAAFTVDHDNHISEVHTENVLAYIPGTDLADELVVITAHYDHVGVENGQVYNGADDDGSGTVALLEMAEAFMQARRNGHGPRRSILIMPVSGEERGLLGSEYYSDHPVFPLENTIANLNIDMIGRTDSAHTEKAPYVYVIGSDRLSTELHAINEEANRGYAGLKLDYTFNAPDDPNRFYYRSDHYNFARKGIPSIFYFSGIHADYHQPTDDVEKIEFDKLRQRALLVFHTAWLLANRTERPKVDVEQRP